MSLPVNFARPPGESPRHYFRTLCINLKKCLHKSTDIEQLKFEMQRFVDAVKQLDWHYKNSEVYRKDEGYKAQEKLWAEFVRYIEVLQTNPKEAKVQDLIACLDEIEGLIDTWKVS